MGNIITAQGVTKTFGNQLVLRDISLTINEGEFVSIVGASGSGKTTLLYCLAGLYKPSSGSICLCGTNIETMPPSKLAEHRRANVGFIFQNFCLIPSLNVLDNILLPVRLSKKHVDMHALECLLQELNLCEKKRSAVETLSGGEQQRVAIARAFIMKPRVIFADEPTASLDTRTGSAILTLIRSLRERYNTTVVLVSHDLAVASAAETAYLLQDGAIKQKMEHPTSDALYAALR